MATHAHSTPAPAIDRAELIRRCVTIVTQERPGYYDNDNMRPAPAVVRSEVRS